MRLQFWYDVSSILSSVYVLPIKRKLNLFNFSESKTIITDDIALYIALQISISTIQKKSERNFRMRMKWRNDRLSLFSVKICLASKLSTSPLLQLLIKTCP